MHSYRVYNYKETWDAIKYVAEEIHLGMSFETTILGKVPYKSNIHSIHPGEVEKFWGIIPPELQAQANAEGFTIIAANWKRGTYTLRKL